MVKIPDSDLAVYIDMYSFAKSSSLSTYLFEGTYDKGGAMKEPVYSSLAWILNKLYDGNVKLFLFTISMLEYTVCVMALYYFGKILRMRLYVVITGIMLICFIPYIFTHTMHLIRQTLANSILCYVMVKRFFYYERKWISMVAMVFIHTTSALFLPLLLISSFGQPFRKAWAWYIGVFAFLAGVQLVSLYLSGLGFLSDGSAVAYAVGKAGGSYSYGDYNLRLHNVIFIILMLLYSILIYYGKILPSSVPLKRFSFVFIFLSIFILVNLQQDMLSARYSHYFFTLVPFLIMVGIQAFRIKNTILFFAFLALVAFFTRYLYTGEWDYDISAGPWMTPVFGYIY